MKTLYLVSFIVMGLFVSGCDKPPHAEPRNSGMMDIKAIAVYPTAATVLHYNGFKVWAWDGIVDFYEYPALTHYRIASPFVIKDTGRKVPDQEFDIFWCLNVTKCY